MTLEEIVGGSKTGYSLETFEDSTITAVSLRMTEKTGKPYLNCLARKKEVQAKPEEVIRQLLLQQFAVEIAIEQSEAAALAYLEG
ncbi:hypothetical protein [Armatimonas sp.]|uniref:hypothetical protein n=1 Tax=Armatimonas sp. TaxID=1872638 RepID=UPI00286A9485|nr:hypothetical protein [Armatimonas sp.]